jgi:CRP-like cAMP-binding protein
MRRRIDPYLDALRRVPLIAASSPRELAAIARNSTMVGRPAGHVFVHEGGRCDEFVVLVSGSVAVVRDWHWDVVAGAGAWWGDADLLAGARSSVTVIALTDVECLVMSRAEFLGVFDDAPSLRRRIVRSLAAAARAGIPARSALAMEQAGEPAEGVARAG